MGFEVIMVSENVPNTPGSFQRKSSGDFRFVFYLMLLIFCNCFTRIIKYTFLFVFSV